MRVVLPNNETIPEGLESNDYPLNLNKTDWQKYYTKNSNLNIDIPAKRNLLNAEIEFYNQRFGQELALSKYLLEKARLKLKGLFNSSVNKDWSKRMEKIDCNNNERIFERLNAIFRPKKPIEIPNLRVPRANIELLNKARIDPGELGSDNDSFIVTDPIKKLDLMGAHFARVNEAHFVDQNTGLNRIIAKSLSNFENEFKPAQSEERPLVEFSNENSALRPKFQQEKVTAQYVELLFNLIQ